MVALGAEVICVRNKGKKAVLTDRQQEAKKLLLNPNISNADIARKLGVSRQRVNELQRELTPNRQKIIAEKTSLKRKKIVELVQEHDLPLKKLSAILNIDPSTLIRTLKMEGISAKERLKEIIRKKRIRSRELLIALGITNFPLDSKILSPETIIDIYTYYFYKYDFVVDDYSLLKRSKIAIDNKIELLDSFGIDWRNSHLGLTILIRNSEDYIIKANALLRNIDATHELDYLLRFDFEGLKAKIQANKKYDVLIERLLRLNANDYNEIALYLRRVIYIIAKDYKPPFTLVDEVVRNTIPFVLSNCNFKKDPALTLSLLLKSVEYFYFNEIKNWTNQKNIEQYSISDDPEFRPRLKPKESQY